MIQLANFEEREFYVMLGKVVTSVDVTFTFQMTEEEFTATLTPMSSTLRASKFRFTATTYPEGQYIVKFVETGQTEVLATVAGFVSGNPIFATSQYNTYNDDGTSTTYVPSDDQGLVPSVSQKLRVSTIDQATDVSYVRYLKVTDGTLTDNGDNSVTLNTGGASSLDDLDDVTITAPLATGQVIVYDRDASPRGFHNQENSLANLTDTNITSTPTNAFLRYVNGAWEAVPVTIPSPPPSTTDGLPEGETNLYYTEARVSANTDVTANTAKVGITAQQAADITANNAKVGITPTQASEITANTAKVGITTQQADDITANNAKVSLIAGGTTGQALVKSTGTDYDVEWADIAVDVQYHNRFQTDAETFRSGATETVELYYTAKADGDGLAESASSDTPAAGYDIRRKLYYAEKAQADPDTSGDWTQFTAIADNTTFANAKAALLAYLKERTGGTVPISLKMTWEEVAQAPSFTGLLNETYGSGAEAAYSTRRLNGLYSGDCMTIRRASDGTTQSIGFVGEEIDESAIETFCSGTTCTVQVWRDQSGNGNDATQTTPANQPTIYTGGQLVTDGGRLALDFDGTDDTFDGTWSIGTTSEFAAFHIVNPTNNNSRRYLYDLRDANDDGIRLLLFEDGTLFFSVDTGDERSTSFNAGQQLMFQNYASSTISVGIDGATANTASAPASTSATANAALYRETAVADRYYFLGKAQEAIFYLSDKSTDRTDIEGNISAYYQSAKLLDEQFGSGAEAAYSTRQLRRDQTECMVIRRASDSTTQTIGFDGSGNIDEAAINTFCSGTSCTVYQWLDQSGNGNDATQTTPANQPTIYTGGALVKENGKVAIQGGLDIFIPHGHNPQNDAKFFGVVKVVSQAMLLGTENTGEFIFAAQSGSSSTNIAAAHTINTQKKDGSTYTGTTRENIYSDFGNRSLLYLDYEATSVTGTVGRFGYPTSGTWGMYQLQEAIWYPDTSTNPITSIESNIGDYFTQNTPLLDTYSGAAAAYSLRLLDSTYTGALVEVYNGSSYADIGANVFGELDTVALADHCGSNDGFVSKWYSQTGSNHATQTTTAKMPKIYDGTTGVVTDNGNPAVQFSRASATGLITPSESWSNSGDINFFSVWNDNGAVGDQYTWQAGTVRWFSGAGLFRVDANGSLYYTQASVGDQNLFVYEHNTTAKSIYIDGVQDATSASPTAISSTSYAGAIGIRNTNSEGSADILMQELIHYPSDQSANRTNIEDNINTFYSIY